MDNNAECKLEDVSCYSPESGFGSEIQYSPSTALKESTKCGQLQSGRLCDASRSLDFYVTAQSKKQAFLQIVDVKSLANTSVNANLQCQAKCTMSNAINGTRHLRLQMQNNKKCLVLDTKHFKPSTFDVAYWKTDNALTNGEKLIMPFSGLPVISKRNSFVSSHTYLDTFVLSLLSKDNRKKYKLYSMQIESNSTKADTNINSKQMDNSQKSNAESNDSFNECKLKSNNDCKTTTASDICSKDLHSSSISVLQTGKTDISLQKPFGIEKQTKNKAEKIRRLKEILLRKEKDLQEVRKNCGFIS